MVLFAMILILNFAEAQPEKLLMCGSMDLRSSPVGTRCKTSKQKLFELLQRGSGGEEAWLDVEANLIWGDKLLERRDRRTALKECQRTSTNHRLPSRAEFQHGERNGIREVLPHMVDHFYWVNSSVPGAVNIGHIFNGNNGQIYPLVYRSINYENIRCISSLVAK